jgi:hypothetical protein
MEIVMTEQTKHLLDEADIGSGEKGAGDRETQKEVEKVPEREPQKDSDALNNAQAQQQMTEGNAVISDELKGIEQQRQLDKGEAEGLVHEHDQLPPKGN